MFRDHRKRVGAVLGMLAALAAVLPAAGSVATTAEPPAPPGLPPPPPLNPPNLQVSPELVEVRSGTPVELTARLYHEIAVPVTVAFEVFDVDARPRHERTRRTVETARCSVAPATGACSVSFLREWPTTAIVSAWIASGEDARRDRDEGRLASVARPPLGEADCTLEDGEPINPNCRNDRESSLAAGRPEPDGTDVVRVAWTGLPQAMLDCDDPGGDEGTERELRAETDRTVKYMCSATLRSTGEPMAGALLNAEILGGPFDPDKGVDHPADYGNNLAADGGPRRLCMTSAPLGHCTFDFKVPGSGPGTAVLCLWVDSDNDGQVGPDIADGGGCADEPVNELEANDDTEAVEVALHR